MKSERSVRVVDDSAFFRTMVVGLLAQEGIPARAAGGGAEGWQMVKEFHPEVVVTDWMMPDVDGLQLCRLIRQHPEHQKRYVILLTSKDRVEDAIAALELGADDFITKSADPREVMVRVKVGLRMAELYAALAEAERRLTVAGMAVTLGHEIFNPLQIIGGFAEILARDGNLPADAREKGASILASARRIQELVKRIQMIENPRFAPYVGETSMIDVDDDPAAPPSP